MENRYNALEKGKRGKRKSVKTMHGEKGNVENGSLSKQCMGKRETWKTEVCQNNALEKGKRGKQKSVKTMHGEKGYVENRSLSKCTGKRKTFVKSIY